MRKFTLFVTSLAFAIPALAEKHESPAVCAGIIKTCEGAGFHRGDHKKDSKGLWVDCVQAIAKGKKVEGVTATQADAKACMEAAKASRKEKK